jgi:hypothetical protein
MTVEMECTNCGLVWQENTDGNTSPQWQGQCPRCSNGVRLGDEESKPDDG